MTKLTISTDSTADIEWCFKEFDITPVPAAIIIGEKIFYDGVDITPDDIYEAVEKRGIMPKTAAGREEDYTAVFEKTKGQPHLHIALSPQFSASHDNAKRAAEKFPNVKFVNSGNMSSGLGMLCVTARELADAGKSVEEIVKILEGLTHKIQSSFMVETLNYLHKGGRCSGLQLMFASILKIHPMIYVEPHGKMLSGKRFRGKYPECIKQYTQHILSVNPNADKNSVFVTHTKIDPKMTEQVESDLKAAGFKKIYNTVLGSCLSAHCGPNTIGILFYNK